jgi:hypothetical protein
MNDKYSQFSGVFIPREVLLDSGIPATAKLLFAIVQSLDNDRGCFASNEYLGGMVGLSESTVRGALAVLEEKKYIIRTVDLNGNRSITTCVTQSFCATPRQISGDPPPENQRPPRQISGTYNNRKKKVVDKIQDLLLPPLPHGEEFAKAWDSWVAYRKELKKPLTNISVREQLKFLTQQTENDAITSIQQSIRSGWLGLFPANRNAQQAPKRLLTDADHSSF